jgi:hypothetical protein
VADVMAKDVKTVSGGARIKPFRRHGLHIALRMLRTTLRARFRACSACAPHGDFGYTSCRGTTRYYNFKTLRCMAVSNGRLE